MPRRGQLLEETVRLRRRILELLADGKERTARKIGGELRLLRKYRRSRLTTDLMRMQQDGLLERRIGVGCSYWTAREADVAKKEFVKPQMKTRTYYDYRECRDYLQQRHGYDERDYAGRFTQKRGRVTAVDESKPYRDFWHWVCDHREIHNGCFITFRRDELAEIEEDWVRTIFGYYLDEFADEKGELEMFVWW